jgi:serine/threonine protein kinase
MINGKLSEVDGMGPMTLGIDEIYLAALEKSTGQERSDYLDKACAGNDTLRRRIERLLRAQSKVGEFLESPAPEIAGAVMPSLAEGPGTAIGPYVLAERIGEGGFGIVYIAEQAAPVRRQVALKIIKPGMDTKEVLARFQTELEVLSIMDHANIARVLDAGATEAGRPYFVMELVRGVPITEYCDQHNLSVHARLTLFVQVCVAVQHAHQKGIIHRDIKPSNVLVAEQDGRSVPKVIDFGVAKAIDRQRGQGTRYTRLAEIIGTPLYMSPEQAGMSTLDIDTRSDIYSLGALLYELLTGSTPFDPDRLHEAAIDEIRRIIREEDPPRPSTRISDGRRADGCRGTSTRRSRSSESTGAGRPRLDRDEIAGKRPGSPLRNGQQPGPGRAALSGRRAGAGVAPIGGVSLAEVCQAEQRNYSGLSGRSAVADRRNHRHDLGNVAGDEGRSRCSAGGEPKADRAGGCASKRAQEVGTTLGIAGRPGTCAAPEPTPGTTLREP